MAGVTVTYKGNTIASILATGALELETGGKFVEGNIGISYEKPTGSVEIETLTVTPGSSGKTLYVPLPDGRAPSVIIIRAGNMTTIDSYESGSAIQFAALVHPSNTAPAKTLAKYSGVLIHRTAVLGRVEADGYSQWFTGDTWSDTGEMFSLIEGVDGYSNMRIGSPTVNAWIGGVTYTVTLYYIDNFEWWL